MASKAWNEAFALQGLGKALSAYARSKAEKRSADQQQKNFESELALKALQLEDAKREKALRVFGDVYSGLQDRPQWITDQAGNTKVVGTLPGMDPKIAQQIYGKTLEGLGVQIAEQTDASGRRQPARLIPMAGPALPGLQSQRVSPATLPLEGAAISPTQAPLTTKQAAPKTIGTVNPAGLAQLASNAEQLLKKIPADIWTGTVTQGTSKVLGGKRGGAGSDDIQLYNSNRPALAVGIYRATTGDTRLSDSDAQARALPLVPSVGETQTVRDAKLAAIKRLPIVAQEVMKSLPPDADEAAVAAAFDQAVAKALTDAQPATEADSFIKEMESKGFKFKGVK